MAPELPFILMVDTSDTVARAVLIQCDGKDMENPVYFFMKIRLKSKEFFYH